MIDSDKKNWAENRTVPTLAAILVFHLLLHIPAFIMPAGANDNDSGTYGIMAMHIAEGDIFPAHYLGKHYIGTLIPHLGAGLFKIFGAGIPAIRLINTIFYGGFILCLFFITKRGFGSRAGLLAAGLAAVTPYEVFNYLKFTEFPEIAFWGSLSLLLLTRIFDSKTVRWSDVLLYGWSLGMGFWAHPQMVYFGVAGVLALLLARPRLLLNIRLGLAFPGFLLGWMPSILHFSHYGWHNFLELIAPPNSEGTGAIIFERLAVLGSHATNYIGATAGGFHQTGQQHLFGELFTYAAAGIFVAASGLFIFLCIRRSNSADQITSGRGARFAILALLIAVPLAFLLSGRSDPQFTSARYIFPIWIAIPAVIAVGADWVQKKQRYAGIAAFAIFVLLFGASYYRQVETIATNDSLISGWIQRLDDHGVKRLIAPRYRSYWITYVTRERIIGAALFPFGDEAYPPYRNNVLAGDGPVAYLFDERLVPGSDATLETLERRLNQLGVTYIKEKDGLGTHIYGLSQPVTPATIANLADEPYGAEIEDIRQRLLTKSDGSHSDVRLFEIDVRNTSGADWYRENRNGFIELVIAGNDGVELRRQPLTANVPTKETATWRAVLTSNEASDATAMIQVNGISILPNDTPIELSSVPLVDPSPLSDFDATRILLDSATVEDHNYFYLSGWTKTIERDGSIRSFTNGHKSELGFIIDEPHPLEIELRLRPVDNPHWQQEDQKVRLFINGIQLGEEIELKESQRLVLEVPQENHVQGLNRFSIEISEVPSLYHAPTRSLYMKQAGVIITGFAFREK